MKKSLGNIAIITTVVNFDLYRKTSPLFPKDIVHYIIDGRNGMHGLNSIEFMFKKLQNRGIEWLIMADEDVIFQNPYKVFELIEYMKNNNFQVAGIREGGMIPHKPFNPYAINTFFCLLHLSEIEKIYNEKEILKNQYINLHEFSEELGHLQKDFNVDSLYEPYYCFYFWLKRKGFKFLYLDASTPFPDDEFTTSVYDTKGQLILFHTWYARAYGTNRKHTDRINRILEKTIINSPNTVIPIIFKDNLFSLKQFIKKFGRKTKLKMEAFINTSTTNV